MSEGCAETTELRTGTSRCDDVSSRCKGSSRPAQRSAFCLFIPPSTISSTPSVTAHPEKRFASSGARHLPSGERLPRLGRENHPGVLLRVDNGSRYTAVRGNAPTERKERLTGQRRWLLRPEFLGRPAFRPSEFRRPVGKFPPSGRHCDQLRPPRWIEHRLGKRQTLRRMLSIKLCSAHLITSSRVVEFWTS